MPKDNLKNPQPKNDEPLPCPFCGEKPLFQVTPSGGRVLCVSEKCRVRPEGRWSWTPEEDWNQRTQPHELVAGGVQAGLAAAKVLRALLCATGQEPTTHITYVNLMAWLEKAKEAR